MMDDFYSLFMFFSVSFSTILTMIFYLLNCFLNNNWILFKLSKTRTFLSMNLEPNSTAL